MVLPLFLLVRARKTVPLYLVMNQSSIKDVENMNKTGGRSRRRHSVAVETVMPLYNIKTGGDAYEHVEIVADVVNEIFDGKTKKKSREVKQTSYKKGALPQFPKAH